MKINNVDKAKEIIPKDELMFKFKAIYTHKLSNYYFLLFDY